MNMERMRSQETQHGFTLLELLVSSAIFGIVLVGIYTAYSASHTTTVRGENRAELQQNARVGMEMMVREIRMAGYDPSDAITSQSTTPIEVADANSICFLADVDGDDTTDRVRYRLQGTQLIRESAAWNVVVVCTALAGGSQLADEVNALAFTYVDATGATIPLTDFPARLADIRLVTVGLTTQGTAGGRLETFPVTMDVRLRN